MTTVTLNADEKNIVYNALRNELTKVQELIADDELFPGELSADEVKTATEDEAMLTALLDKLA